MKTAHLPLHLRLPRVSRLTRFPLFIFLVVALAVHAFGGDAKVTLSSADGTSAFIVRDSASNELARVQSDGKVGIGVPAPAYKLDVAGDINLTGLFYTNGVAWSPLASFTEADPAFVASAAHGIAAGDIIAWNAKVSATRNINTTAPLSGGGTMASDLTLALPAATTSANGYLASADWNTFNNKTPASRTLGTTAPLTGGGDLSANRTLSINQAATSTDGYLSSANWNTFNGKVGSVTAGSPLASSGGTTPNLTIQTASGSQAGALSSTDWTTFNGKVSNVQSDWNATNGLSQIINKPAIGTMAAQSSSNVTITGGSGVYSSLKVSATNSALTLSCLTTAQRDAMTPGEGMVIYNTTTKKFQGFGPVTNSGVETLVLNQWNSQNFYDIANTNNMGQSIKLGANGFLTKVTFSMHYNAGTSGTSKNFTLNVWPGDGGFTNLLHTQQITISNPAVSEWKAFVLSTPLRVVADTSYIVEVVNSDTSTTGTVGVRYYSSDYYAGSMAYRDRVANSGTDFAIQAFMSVDVPFWADLN